MYNIVRQMISANKILGGISMVENVSGELKKYLEGKPFISKLLSFDMIILYASVALMIINIITYLGGIISGLILYVFVLGILLCIANNNYTALTLGLGVAALIEVVKLIISIFSKYSLFSWVSLYAVIIYGFFAYMAYNKTTQKR